LQVGAAAESDNRDHSFPAYRAARRLTHEILLILHPNSELEFLFQSSLSAKREDPVESALGMPPCPPGRHRRVTAAAKSYVAISGAVGASVTIHDKYATVRSRAIG
jgi:hypothetical protein